MKKINIFTFTVGRSDFGILQNLLIRLKKNKRFNSNLVVNEVHKSKIFGDTSKEIKNIHYDKLHIVRYKLTSNDINFNISQIIRSYNNFFKKNKIDACIILGDRYEMMSISMVIKKFLIPIFHLHGGAETLGSLDNIYRYTISKMADVHFVETNKHKKNLIKMNIKKNIFVVGAPSLENSKKNLTSKKEFQTNMNIEFNPFKKIIISCFHSETILNLNENLTNLKNLLIFLKSLKQNIVITYPNADHNFKSYIDQIEKYRKEKNFFIFKNLGRIKYFSLLNFGNLLIGNSSSGIIETANFKIPCLNLGNRQKNRFHNQNVMHSKFDLLEMKKKYKILTANKFYKKISNIKDLYYKPNTSKKIADKIFQLLFKN